MARALDENKRTAILEAAKSVFLNVGYANAKISDIAAAAGVAAGTLYLYYDSKEALASAIGESFFARLSKQFGLVVKKIKGPDGIDQFVDWALTISEQEKDVLAIARESQQSPKPKESSRKILVIQLAEVFKEGMEHREIRNYSDPELLAEMVLAVIRRLFMSQAIFKDQDKASIKTVASQMLKHALFDDSFLEKHRR